MVSRFMLDDAGELIDLNNHKFVDYGEECCNLLNELHRENKELQEFKDKVFNLIEKTIEDETQIAENIESIIKGDYVKAVNRLTIITLENLKKEFKE